MRYFFFILWSLLVGGALFVMLFGAVPLAYTAPGATDGKAQVAALPFSFEPRDFNVLESVLRQLKGVTSFAAQAITAATQINLRTLQSGDEQEVVQGTVVINNPSDFAFPALESMSAGSLVMNIPLAVNENFTARGLSSLANTTINGTLLVSGGVDVQSLVARGSLRAGSGSFSSLTVASELQAASALIGGPATVSGLLTAQGGIATNGADIDLEEGNIYAANIVNELVAGRNITIEGTPNAPIISARSVSVPRPDLADVRARGGCAECLLDTDVSDALTLLSGTVNGTPIGLSSAAQAAFTDVVVGTTTATATLSVYGNLTVANGATSTFASSINVTSGCVAVNGVCLGGGVTALNDLSDVTLATTTLGEVLLFDGSQWVNVATSSLGFDLSVPTLGELTDVTLSTTTFGDLLQFNGTEWINVSTSSLGLANTFLDLSDTPSSYIANALLFSTSSASGLSQSANLVFDGTNLGVGTSTPITTLSVNGNVGVLGQQALRFYNAANTQYVGFRASSTLSASTLWSLPASDGASNTVLVTDGSGNLRFANVTEVGGGSETYIDLTDTPSAYVARAIPFASSTANELLFSSNFVFDGTNLGVGLGTPSEELTVRGSVRFEADASTPGFVYNAPAHQVGIGTDAPSARLTVEGGSILQRGGATGNTYSPQQVGSLDLPDNGTDVKIVGQYAYVTNGSGGNEFRIINIANAASPSTVGSLNLPATANALAVSGKYAYVVTDVSASEFHVVDISNPALPQSVATVNLPSTAFDIFVQGKFAYVATDGTGDDFHIIDISNPLAPSVASSLELSAGVNGIHVLGNYAYIAKNTSANEFQIINITNPYSPSAVGEIDLPSTANEVFVEGNRAYIVTSSAGNNFLIIDISNPVSPSTIGTLALTSTGYGVRVSGDYAYVTTSGSTDNIAVVNVSNPALPILVGSRNLTSGTAFAIDVIGTYAYVVTTSVGDDFHVMDISGVNAQGMFAHSLSAGSFALRGDALIGGMALISNGLRVGSAGMQTAGSMFAQGTSTSFFLGSLGVGTTTSSNKLSLYSASGNSAIEFGVLTNKFTFGVDQSDGGKFKISSSSALGTNDRLTIDGAGRVGIGTASPSQLLHVAGAARITGALYDNSNSAGTNGMVLQSTGSGFQWVATSTLGLGGGAALTVGSDNQIPYSNSGGTDFDYSSNFTFDGSLLSLTGDFHPGTTLTYDLGSSTRRWDNVWAQTLNVGTSTWSIFNGANGRLAFSNAAEQGGTESLSVLTNGNVGIGTTTPSSKLSIYGDALIEGSNRYINFGATAGTSGYGIRDNGGTIEVKSSGGSWAPLIDNVVVLSAINVYTTNTSWTKPSDLAYAVVEVRGGGGSAGANVNGAAGTGGGGGGGEGGYSEEYLKPSELSASETIIIGAGGTDPGSGNPGNTGGTTSFGAHLSATGGGGGDAGSNNSSGEGGLGGLGSGGDLNLRGESGAQGSTASGAVGGSGGGAGGGNNGTAGTMGGGGGGSRGAGGSGYVVVYEYVATTSLNGGADLAELYPTKDPTIEAGDIVMFAGIDPIAISRAEEASSRPLAGIISTKPGLLLGSANAGQRPVALSGRVPTKVNNEGGPIKMGDRIALSSVPGVGKKATPFEDTVGIAISNYEEDENGQGTVMVFIDLQQGIDMQSLVTALLATSTASSTDGFDFIGTVLNSLMERMGFQTNFATVSSSTATSTASTTTQMQQPDTIWSRIAQLAESFMDGVLNILGLKVNVLCLVEGDKETCIDRAILQELLEQSSVEPKEIETETPGDDSTPPEEPVEPEDEQPAPEEQATTTTPTTATSTQQIEDDPVDEELTEDEVDEVSPTEEEEEVGEDGEVQEEANSSESPGEEPIIDETPSEGGEAGQG